MYMFARSSNDLGSTADYSGHLQLWIYFWI